VPLQRRRLRLRLREGLLRLGQDLLRLLSAPLRPLDALSSAGDDTIRPASRTLSKDKGLISQSREEMGSNPLLKHYFARLRPSVHIRAEGLPCGHSQAARGKRASAVASWDRREGPSLPGP
jgi:hypothetical protein